MYYVYIMASRSKVLYTGVTNNLERRVSEHKSGETPGFSQQYQTTFLVYYDAFKTFSDAVTNEKRIKGWTRAKKIALIKELNPYWDDLAESLNPPEPPYPASS